MAKGKGKTKTAPTIPNKNVYSRLSYMYQAAAYLSNEEKSSAVAQEDSDIRGNDGTLKDEPLRFRGSQTKLLLNQMRGMTRKAQIHLRPELKRTICKRCDALLIPGRTSTVVVENVSKDGHKAWADVLIYKCNDCLSIKRFPIGQSRQVSRSNTGIEFGTQDHVQHD